MAVSPNTQDLPSNPKSEDENSTPSCDVSRSCTSNENNNEENKNCSGAISQIEHDNNNLNVSTVVPTTNAIRAEHSDHTNSTSLPTNTDLVSSPQNTVGLPFSENRTEIGAIIHSEIDRNPSSHVPPALPPRPANLPLPQVNGLPHPPHAFSASQGEFRLY